MERLDAFSERLRRRLDEAEAAKGRRLQDDEIAMRERDRGYARFERAGEPLHRLIIQPIVDELARNFANASAEHFRTPGGFLTQCRFAHTERFPATVKLLFGLEWHEADHHAWLVYSLEILPELLAFDKTDRLEISLDAPDESEIREWAEGRIVRFLDTYLQLESDPHYQSGHARVDPVCGMLVSAASAGHRLEHDGKAFLFCSQLCHDRFAADPGLYLTGKSGLPDGDRAGGRSAHDG